MTIAKLILFLTVSLWLRDGFTQPASRGLPEPRIGDGPALSTVLATRRSIREFGSRELSEAEVGQLLWAAQGVIDGHRTAPSAGGLYPLTIRVADGRGVWRYLPEDHMLHHESPDDVRGELAVAAYRQHHIRIAPIVIIMTTQVAITANKYGPRAERFVALEAGHVAQNLLLQATALRLGGVPVGAFDDDAVRRLLGAGADVTPLYLVAIGAPP